MMMKCSVPTNSIDKIDLCVTGIEIYFSTIVFHLSHFNTLKSVLYIEKLANDQQIILNNSVMSQKRGLVTVIPILRPAQNINQIYNIGLPTIKMLIKIKA